jgi:hypothetical protein
MRAELPGYLTARRALFALVWVASAVAVYLIDARDQPPAFVIEMRSSTGGVAQLFYDAGGGINQKDSAHAPVSASTAFLALRFPLPDRAISAIRFDPLSGPGTFSIRGVFVVDSYGRPVRRFALSELRAQYQIASRVDGASDVTFTTAADANDPILQVALLEPLQPPAAGPGPVRLALHAVVALVIAAAVAAAGTMRRWYLATRTRDAAQATVESRVSRVVARIVLGYVLAIAALIVQLPTTAGHTLAIRMTTDVPGALQVFYDVGKGFNEGHSAATSLSAGRREYVVPLPVGEYRALRIDPGPGEGRYTIDRAAIRRPDGSTWRLLPVSELIAGNQLTVTEQTKVTLVVDSGPGSNDPQLVYQPSESFSLTAEPLWPRLVARLLSLWIGGVLVTLVLERAMRPLAPVVFLRLERAALWSAAHPRFAVAAAAAIATLLSTYPLVFVNRSLVSPNNGGAGILYDRPPYLPGSADVEIEHVRAADVGATMWAFVPYSQIQRQALAHGELPLWNRFNGNGRPLWGQGQGFPLDPLHWFTWLTPDLALGWDLKFVAHRFVFAAGVGIAALIGSGSWLAAMVVAAAAPFLGYYTFRFNHPGLFSLSYAPWILAGWFTLAESSRPPQMARAALLMAAASALALFASPPKEGLVMLAGCHTAGLASVLLNWSPPSQTWRRMAFAAAAGFAAVLLTAPQWMVFLETLEIAATGYDVPRVYFATLQSVPALLLGSLSPVFGLPSLHIVGTLLLMAAVASPWRVVRRRALLGCAIAATGLIAIGFGAIPGDWLLRVPLVGNIYGIHMTTAAAALVLVLVVCAGGVEVLLTSSAMMIGLLTLAAALLSAWIFADASRRATDPLQAWLAGLLLAGGVAMPVCVLAACRAGRRVLPLVCVASLGLALLWPGGLQVTVGNPALDWLLPQPRLRVDLEFPSPAIAAVHQHMSEPARAVGLGYGLSFGTQSLYGLESIGGPDALSVRRYEELVDAARIERPWGPLVAGGWLTIVQPPDLVRLAPLLDMLNVGFLLAPAEAVITGFDELPMSGSDRLKALRRRSAWPRAYFADGVSLYGEVQELLNQAAGHSAPLAAVQSTDREAVDATRHLPQPTRHSQPARDYRLTFNTTSFVVTASGPGVAVLSEAFIPGDFRATVNGEPVPYVRVNHASKAVVVPSAGVWTVTFEYRPRFWNLSLALAAGGLVACAGLAFLARKI